MTNRSERVCIMWGNLCCRKACQTEFFPLPLQSQADSIVGFLMDANLVKQLKQDKSYNLHLLQEQYNIGPPQIEALYHFAKNKFECGNYQDAAEFLYHYRWVGRANHGSQGGGRGRFHWVKRRVHGEWGRFGHQVRAGPCDQENLYFRIWRGMESWRAWEPYQSVEALNGKRRQQAVSVLLRGWDTVSMGGGRGGGL